MSLVGKVLLYGLMIVIALVVADFVTSSFLGRGRGLSPGGSPSFSSGGSSQQNGKGEQSRQMIRFGPNYACYSDDYKCIEQGRKLQQENSR